jgi:hypothetical protein
MHYPRRVVDLKAGDQIKWQLQSFGNALDIVGGLFGVKRISSPQTIGMNEVVAFRANVSSGPSIPSASFTTINYNNVELDTHNCYSSGQYIVPRTGIYTVDGAFQTIIRATTINYINIIALFVNGSQRGYLGRIVDQSTSTARSSAAGSTTIRLNAGDVVTWRVYVDTATSLSTDANANFVSLRSN